MSHWPWLSPGRAKHEAGPSFLSRAMPEEGLGCKPAAGCNPGFRRRSCSVLQESQGTAPLHPPCKPGEEKLKGQRPGKRSFQGCDVVAQSSERLPCALGSRLALWGFMSRPINRGDNYKTNFASIKGRPLGTSDS